MYTRSSEELEKAKYDSSGDPSAEDKSSISCEARIGFVVLIIVVAALVGVLFSDPEVLINFLRWAENNPRVAAIVIAGGFIPLSVIMIPLDMALYVASGYLYGLSVGFVICFVGYNVGSWFGFYAVRFMLRDWVESQVKHMVSYKALTNAVAERGFVLVLLLQMAPIMPYSLISYFFGSSEIHFGTFALATAIGSMPFVFFFTMMGATMNSIEEAAAGKIHHDTTYWVVTSVGMLAAILSIALLAIAAKNEVRKVVARDSAATADAEPLTSSPLLRGGPREEVA